MRPRDETEGVLFALAQAVEQRDSMTAGHCERLAFLSVMLGMALHLSRRELVALYHGGFLHDIGKVGLPDAILFKPGSLTTEEWSVMRSHAARGEEICRSITSLHPVLPIIRHHHERWDGSGYPDGLRGEQIPLLARVLQAVDIYDALISPRPYKAAITPASALDLMKQETDRGWRDPQVMTCFFQLHDRAIANVPEYRADGEGNLERMQESLRSLHEYLAEDTAPIPEIEIPKR